MSFFNTEVQSYRGLLFSRTNGRWPKGKAISEFGCCEYKHLQCDKSAAVSRITNPDTHCGRITNAPEPGSSLITDPTPNPSP